LHTDTTERFEMAREALAGAYSIGDAAPPERPLILDRID
jgi:thymidine phosphorylase